MLLKDIKEIEFQLLLIEDKQINIDFIDYLILEKKLDEVGKITSLYMKYIQRYADLLTESNTEIRQKLLIEKNNSLLETDIDVDLTEVKEIIKKYKV